MGNQEHNDVLHQDSICNQIAIQKNTWNQSLHRLNGRQNGQRDSKYCKYNISIVYFVQKNTGCNEVGFNVY